MKQKKVTYRRKYVPLFRGAIQGHLINTINRDLWRVDQVMTREDFYQDGLLIFHMLCKRYTCVDNPKWFMSLYKASLRNHIHLVSRVQTRLRSQSTSVDLLQACSSAQEEVEAIESFDNAPDEILEIVRLFLTAPTEVWDLLSTAWNAKGNRRKKGKRLIARCLCKEDDYDAKRVLHHYLDGEGVNVPALKFKWNG